VAKERARLVVLQSAAIAEFAGLRTLVQTKSIVVGVAGLIPEVSFAAATQVIDEGVQGQIEVRLDFPRTVPIEVFYTVTGTASGPGAPSPDHDLVSGSVVFPPNSVSQMIPVNLEEGILEGTETILVTLVEAPEFDLGEIHDHEIAIRDMQTGTISYRMHSDGSPIYAEIRLDEFSQATDYAVNLSGLEFDFDDGSNPTFFPRAELAHNWGLRRAIAPGTYDMKITPIGTRGERHASTIQEITFAANNRPVPKVVVNSVVGFPLKLEFDASTSSDSDGLITNVEWDFGDGTTASGLGSITVEHEFYVPANKDGNEHQVTLTLTDDDHAQHTITLWV
jgi:hypothetical protein